MKKTAILFCGLAIAGFTNFYSTAQKQPKKPVAKASTSKAKTAAKSTAAKSTSTPAEIAQGKDLISKSDCMACHQLTARVVGPAYSAVAQKYPATSKNVDMLAEKVIKGGAGNWGQIPMTPHPQIQAEDAKKMVRYILSVKAK